MASLQEIQGNLTSLHKSIVQGELFLSENIKLCNQWSGQLNNTLAGTALSEYSQIMSILHSVSETLKTASLALKSTDESLVSWTKVTYGVPLFGEPLHNTSCDGFESLENNTNTKQGDNYTKHLSPEEVADRWAIVNSTTDEVIDNYRAALISLGVADGKMLDRFLRSEKNKMLKYEAAVLDNASGHGDISEDDKYTYRIAGGTGEYGYDSLAHEYGLFCLNDVSSWIKDINPNYNKPFDLPQKNPYHVNCGSCAFAVETRLSGGEPLVATTENIGTDYAMEVATGKKCVYMSIEEIEEHLRKQGPGSHAIAGINRYPAYGTPLAGHWFNVFFDGENFHTIDGQSGEIFEWPHDYNFISEWCALI